MLRLQWHAATIAKIIRRPAGRGSLDQQRLVRKRSRVFSVVRKSRSVVSVDAPAALCSSIISLRAAARRSPSRRCSRARSVRFCDSIAALIICSLMRTAASTAG